MMPGWPRSAKRVSAAPRGHFVYGSASRTDRTQSSFPRLRGKHGVSIKLNASFIGDGSHHQIIMILRMRPQNLLKRSSGSFFPRHIHEFLAIEDMGNGPKAVGAFGMKFACIVLKAGLMAIDHGGRQIWTLQHDDGLQPPRVLGRDQTRGKQHDQRVAKTYRGGEPPSTGAQRQATIQTRLRHLRIKSDTYPHGGQNEIACWKRIRVAYYAAAQHKKKGGVILLREWIHNVSLVLLRKIVADHRALGSYIWTLANEELRRRSGNNASIVRQTTASHN